MLSFAYASCANLCNCEYVETHSKHAALMTGNDAHFDRRRRYRDAPYRDAPHRGGPYRAEDSYGRREGPPGGNARGYGHAREEWEGSSRGQREVAGYIGNRFAHGRESDSDVYVYTNRQRAPRGPSSGPSELNDSGGASSTTGRWQSRIDQIERVQANAVGGEGEVDSEREPREAGESREERRQRLLRLREELHEDREWNVENGDGEGRPEIGRKLHNFLEQIAEDEHRAAERLGWERQRRAVQAEPAATVKGASAAPTSAILPGAKAGSKAGSLVRVRAAEGRAEERAEKEEEGEEGGEEEMEIEDMETEAHNRASSIPSLAKDPSLGEGGSVGIQESMISSKSMAALEEGEDLSGNAGDPSTEDLTNLTDLTDLRRLKEEEEEAAKLRSAMQTLMGFTTFDTSKGKDHSGTDLSGVKAIPKRTYRQYMNRRGGFNRPLSPT